MHGKTDTIHCQTTGLFAGLPESFTATRYHSLIVERSSLPSTLEITAHSKDDLIMGLKHKAKPIYGLQFHPESILTEHGKKMIANFLALKGVA
jgi:anthranilate synthase/aminodeoxychorismate synthase-like glutamine amidotransferase